MATSVQFTLTGTGLADTAEINYSGNGITISNYAVLSDTSLTGTFAVLPSASSGHVHVVTRHGRSNDIWLEVVGAAPSIGSFQPAQGPAGASVTINGANFGATQGASTVTFEGEAMSIQSWADGKIVVTIPAGAPLGAGNIVVTVGGLPSNSEPFTVTGMPSITGVSPASAGRETTITITGTNLGSAASGTITINGAPATATTWNAGTIVVDVPAGATVGPGTIVVYVAGVATNSWSFTVTPAPAIISVQPPAGPIGAVVTVNGEGFGATQGNSTVYLGTTQIG